jgi:hypothetical protein
MFVRPLRFALHKIQDECLKLEKPILTALVVRKDRGNPCEGSVVFGEEDFLAALAAVARPEKSKDPCW